MLLGDGLGVEVVSAVLYVQRGCRGAPRSSPAWRKERLLQAGKGSENFTEKGMFDWRRMVSCRMDKEKKYIPEEKNSNSLVAV